MDQGDKPNVIFTWKAHPAKQHVGRACLGLVVISLAGLGVAVAAGHPVWGVLGAVALLLSLQRFFFPSSFEIDEAGITARYLMSNKRMRWSAARRLVVDANGGFLSTRGRKSWLDAYRGLHLVWNEQRNEAIAAVEARLAATRSAAEASASPAHGPKPTAHSHRTAGSPA